MTRALVSLCLIVIAALLCAASATAATYVVTDFGTSPLGTGYVSGINSSGTVVGNAGFGDSQRGFVWNAATGFTYLDPLSGCTSSSASGINDSGQVVGASSSPTSDSRATLWQSGQPAVYLGALGATQDSTAFSINNAGQVVGYSRADDGSWDAFLWDSIGGMQDIIGADSTQWAVARAINDLGTVAGEFGDDGFLWTSAAGVTDMNVEPPADRLNISVVDANNSAQVLCNWVGFGAIEKPFVWHDGQIVASIGLLPDLGSYRASHACDINNLGQVVGCGDHYRAFIWDEATGIQELPVLEGFTRHDAYAINDAGVIAGCGRDASGRVHLLLWTPVPEPSSLLALLAGLGGVGGIFLRRTAA